MRTRDKASLRPAGTDRRERRAGRNERSTTSHNLIPKILLGRGLLAAARVVVALAHRLLTPAEGDVFDAERSALLDRADLAGGVLR